MAWSLVQAPVGVTAAAATKTLAFASSPTAGNLIAVLTDNNGSASTITTISDTLGTTFNANTPFHGGGTLTTSLTIYWGIVPSTGADTVTATWNSGTNMDLYIAEYSIGSTLVGQGLRQLNAMLTMHQPGSASWAGPTFTSTGSTPLFLMITECASTGAAVAGWTTVGGSVIDGDPASFLLNSASNTPTLTQSASGQADTVGIVLDFPATGSAFIPHRMPLGV